MAKTLEEMQKDYEALEASMKAAKDKVAELEREKAAPSHSEADERRILRSFHCGDVKSLLNVNVAKPEFASANISDRLAVIELKKDIDLARWSAQIFEGAEQDKGEMEKQGQVARVKNLLDTRIAKELDLRNRLKAFGTDQVNQGAEWIETAISSNYIEEYQLEKKVANLFTEIPMPTNPFKLPVVKASTTARIVAESAAGTGANSQTADLTFDAANKLFELYNLPEELTEDSAVTFLSLGRQQVIEAQLRAIETALINGDLTAVHMDGVGIAADDARRTVKGLRKSALAASSTVDFAGAISAAKMDALIKLMGKFSLNTRETVILCSANGSHQLTALPEVSTVDKFGPMATILSGYLAAYRGRPIVASEYIAENMNASGVYDGVTTTKGGIIIVNKTRFMIGRRRPIRIRVSADARAEYDRYQLASYQRMDFQGMPQSATERSVAYGINITI